MFKMEESKEGKRWSILTGGRMHYPISAVRLRTIPVIVTLFLEGRLCYPKPGLLSLGPGSIWG